MGQESIWAAIVYSPERVELAVNSTKETIGRVKKGQESKWAKGQDGPLLFNP